MKLHTVGAALLEDLWPAATPLIERGCEWHPLLNAQDIVAILRAGRADLIICVEEGHIIAAAVMDVVQLSTARIGNVLCFAGEFGVYRNYLCAIMDYLEQWSRDHGCNKMCIVGRPGWRKFLNRRGWNLQPCITASRTL